MNVHDNELGPDPGDPIPAAPNPLESYSPQELRAELDRRAGKPTESCVSGRLVKMFSDAWPDGYYWYDEALFQDPEDDDPDLPGPGLDEEDFYDFSGWDLDQENGKVRSLWDVFSEWLRSHPGALRPLDPSERAP